MQTFVRQVMGAASQLERGMIAARLRAGRRLKAERGGYAYGAPPTGWTTADGVLVPNEREQEGLLLITTKRAEGASLRAIAQALTDQDHRPRRGERWHSMVVSRIVHRSGDNAVA